MIRFSLLVPRSLVSYVELCGYLISAVNQVSGKQYLSPLLVFSLLFPIMCARVGKANRESDRKYGGSEGTGNGGCLIRWFRREIRFSEQKSKKKVRKRKNI